MRIIDFIHKLLRKPALRQGGIVLLDQGLMSVSLFLTGVLFARANSKEEYGVYVLGWSLILALQGIHRALVTIPFTIYAPRVEDRNRESYQGSALVHTIILAAIVMLCMVVIQSSNLLSGDASNNRFLEVIPLLAIMTGSYLLREFIRNALLARLKFMSSVLVNIVATAFQFALIIWLFAEQQLTAENTFRTLALISIVAAAYMIWAERANTSVMTSRLWPDFCANWKMGKWVLVEAFAYTGASQIYPWLLIYFTDAKSVAIFGACSAVAGLMSPFLRGASAYIQPRMAHGYKSNDPENLLRLLRLSTIALGVPYFAWFVIGGIFGDAILTGFYSSTYSGYGFLVFLLIFKMLIESVSTPLTQTLQTLGHPRVVAVSLAIGAVITLGAGSILIKYMGLSGAGIAAVLSSMATMGWKWARLRIIVHQSRASRD